MNTSWDRNQVKVDSILHRRIHMNKFCVQISVNLEGMILAYYSYKSTLLYRRWESKKGKTIIGTRMHISFNQK